jgi:hypothetical protein
MCLIATFSTKFVIKWFCIVRGPHCVWSEINYMKHGEFGLFVTDIERSACRMIICLFADKHQICKRYSQYKVLCRGVMQIFRSLCVKTAMWSK